MATSANAMESSRASQPTFSGPRRVFTSPPPGPTSRGSTSSLSGDGLVETLYNHPSVKIVSFTAGSRPVPLSPGRGITSPVEVEPGSLEWSSQLERTIAVGPFRIYRAPGSVAFLSCGSALQPILPKSQCWCVDEQSTRFVLQIRRPQYWRIEIPAVEAEDSRRAQLLREVFDKVLQFEKTPCPFRRTFTVDLPQRPQTPVKRPWTPVRRSFVSMPPTPVTPLEMANRFTVSRKHSLPGRHEPFQAEEGHGKLSISPAEQDDPIVAEARLRCPEPSIAGGASPSSEEDQTASLNQSIEPPASDDLGHMPAITHKLGGFQASRSATAPPHLTLVTSPTKSAEKPAPEPLPDAGEGNSPTGSSDSFHTVQSWHSPITPLPPSPPSSNPSSPKAFPYPHENIALPKKSSHQREISDLTITLDRQTWGVSSAEGPAGGPIESPAEAVVEASAIGQSLDENSPRREPKSLDSDAGGSAETTAIDDVTTGTVTRRPHYRHRATTSSISVSRRALSPLPPAANLFSPPKQYTDPSRRSSNGRLAVARRLPMAVIHKTCEILLSPPGHLINLMLRVAARIVAGEWRGFVFGTSDLGESIPVQWDYSDEEYMSWDAAKDVAEDCAIDQAARPTGGDDGHELGGDDLVRQSHRMRRKSAGGAAGSTSQQKAADEDEPDPDWSRSWGVD